MPPRCRRWPRASRSSASSLTGKLDYNRFCPYGFVDRRREHAMDWHAGDRAFATTGAWLIEDWADHHCRTGDPETLEWARRMTDKWAAAQDAQTGLLSHFYGSAGPEQTTRAAKTGDARLQTLQDDSVKRALRAEGPFGQNFGTVEELMALRLRVLQTLAGK
jgi:hypothetical protein